MEIRFLIILTYLFLGDQTCISQAPIKGQVAHYLFNADAKDISGNNNHGYITGGVFPTKDRFNNDCGAMKFNGSDGYIHVPHSISLSMPQNAYTIALWFKALDGSEYSDLQWMTICCKSNIREENLNSPQFRLQSTRYTVSMNTDFTEKFDHQIEFNKWYHYVVTYDGSYCRVYLDNKEIVNWSYKTRFYPNKLAMEIGRDLPGQIEYFCGVMDDLYIYDRALSPREISDIYFDQSEKNSPKPCGFIQPIAQSNPNNQNRLKANAAPDSSLNNKFLMDFPKIIDNDTIEYQQTIVVKNPNVKLLFYDGEKEDGDIVSVNFNGAWVLEKYKLKKKTSVQPKILNLSLIPNFENYIFTKAWNLGTIPPNTLTVEIIDTDGSDPPRVVNIKSAIGRSGAIKLVYKP